MDNFPKVLLKKLETREEQNAMRVLPSRPTLIDFSSNDYLGFSKSGKICQDALESLNGKVGNGATGSRLLTGNHGLYPIAEEMIAQFHIAETALLFNSGYDANIGVFSSIPQKGDIVLYDEYIHASIRDGLRLSNAKAYKFRHNDTIHLETLISRLKNRVGEVYIVVESVFSMDGDQAPLDDITVLAGKYHCRVIVDEAHALGVAGDTGEGVVQQLGLQDKIFTRIVTFGKGLGSHGAAVLGSKELKNYLVNFARSFIYTTGLPPHSVATIISAYNYLQSEGQHKLENLKNIISFFKSELERQELQKLFIHSTSAIHCAIVPGNDKVKNISTVLKQGGFDVKPILSPTVPAGQERLRICLHSYNTEAEIINMLTALRRALLQ